MISFQNTLSIRQPVEMVFHFYSNVENLKKWNYYVLDVKKTTPHILNKGAEFELIRKKDTLLFIITSYEENKSITYQRTNSKTSIERTTTFQAVGNAVVIDDKITINTPFPGFIERFFTKRIRLAVLDNLRLLKRLLEDGSVTLQDGRFETLTG